MSTPSTARSKAAALLAAAALGVALLIAWLWRVEGGAAASEPAAFERGAARGGVPSLEAEAAAMRREHVEPEVDRSEAPAEPEPTWSAPAAPLDEAQAPPTVAVHVWRSGAPAAGVPVRAEIQRRSSEAGALERVTLEALTDHEGRCVFDARDFESGTAFVGMPGEAELNVELPKPDQMRHPRVYVRLGSATVFGVAYGASGDPLEGAMVRLKSDYQRWTATVHSGLGGLYEIAGVPSGGALVILGAEADDVLGGKIRVELGERESRRVDLGRAEGAVLWSGRVSVLGAAAPSEFWAFHKEARRPFRIAVTDGRFAVRVAPGEYEVARSAAFGANRIALSIGAQDTALDVELPAAEDSDEVRVFGDWNRRRD